MASAGNDNQRVGGQASQQIRARPQDRCGDQQEDGSGREHHQPADDDHRDIVDRFEERHERLTPRRVQRRRRRSEHEDREYRREQISLRRRRDWILRHDRDQRLHQSWHGADVALRRLAGGLEPVGNRVANTRVQPGACASRQRHRGADDRPQDRGGKKVDERPAADAPEPPRVSERRDAREETRDHQRHDDHRNQSDEDRPERFEGGDDPGDRVHVPRDPSGDSACAQAGDDL